jgi:hypothetical protein
VRDERTETECCGVPLAADQRFCSKCGWEARAKIDQAKGPAPTSESEKVCVVCRRPCHHDGRRCTCVPRYVAPPEPFAVTALRERIRLVLRDPDAVELERMLDDAIRAVREQERQ